MSYSYSSLLANRGKYFFLEDNWVLMEDMLSNREGMY